MADRVFEHPELFRSIPATDVRTRSRASTIRPVSLFSLDRAVRMLLALA